MIVVTMVIMGTLICVLYTINCVMINLMILFKGTIAVLQSVALPGLEVLMNYGNAALSDTVRRHGEGGLAIGLDYLSGLFQP